MRREKQYQLCHTETFYDCRKDYPETDWKIDANSSQRKVRKVPLCAAAEPLDVAARDQLDPKNLRRRTRDPVRSSSEKACAQRLRGLDNASLAMDDGRIPAAAQEVSAQNLTGLDSVPLAIRSDPPPAAAQGPYVQNLTGFNSAALDISEAMAPAIAKTLLFKDAAKLTQHMKFNMEVAAQTYKSPYQPKANPKMNLTFLVNPNTVIPAGEITEASKDVKKLIKDSQTALSAHAYETPYRRLVNMYLIDLALEYQT